MKTALQSLLLCGILAAAPTLTHAQTSNPTVKDELFAGTEKFARGASDIEEITMDHDSLAKVGGQASGMMLNVVRTYTYPKPGMYNTADVDEFRNKLNTGDWHCSVHISHPLKGESTDVCERRRSDNMHESAIITVEPKQLTFIHKITRDHTPGNQSWNSYTGMGAYGGAYFGAEGRVEMEVAMAEMHASMAGMSAGFINGGVPLALEMQNYSRPSARALQQLSNEIKNMPPSPQPLPELKKQLEQNKK